MTIAEAIRAAAERLGATSDTARLDAEVLMAHALAVSRSDLLLRHMRDPAPHGFAALIERRARHEPVAHITGRQEFYGLDLIVTPDTLIPRGDSETLIEAARAHFADRAPPVCVLDMGTGTGALLLAALSQWPMAQGVAIDASEAACAVAAGNAGRLGFGGRTRFLHRSWLGGGWADDIGRFDLILSNPPYVEQHAVLAPSVRDYEPASALFAGEEGLDDYRAIIPQLGKLLVEGGIAVLEIGATQASAVSQIARESGFAVTAHCDLAGRMRALLLL